MGFDITESKLYSIIKLIVNVLIILFGFYISFYIRYGQNIQDRNIEPFFALMPYIALISLFFFYIYLADNNGDDSYIDKIISSGLAIAMIQICTMALTFFARGFAFPRSIFAISFLIHIAAMSMWKRVVISFEYRYGGQNRLLLVGDDEKNRRTAGNILKMKNSRIKVVGDMAASEFLGKMSFEDIDSICITGSVEFVPKEEILESAVSQNKNIYILPDLYEIILSNSKLGQFDDMPVFKARRLSLSMEQRFMKRMLDLALVIPGLIIAAPFMFVAVLMIKKDDGGPIFFKQERLTVEGRKFELVKFRTMVVDAEAKTGPVLAGMDDPRITNSGKLLRATRLDELPQLFNVLKGELSLVGPRPERKFFYDEFEKAVPRFKYRLSVKGGVTGLGQILGKYTTSPDDKLAYDLLYAYNYSILLDIKIILQTIRIMMKKSSSDGSI